MVQDAFAEQMVETWRVHEASVRQLLDAVPRGGFKALPEGAEGRDVGRQFAHMARVRDGWVHVHRTGEKPNLPPYHEGKTPTKAALRKMLKASGKAVEGVLAEVADGSLRPRAFGRSAVRWLGYQLAHEGYHMGQIVQSLVLAGFEWPEETTQELWSTWIQGS